MTKKRVLIFIVAYNAANTIKQVLTRIPSSLCDSYELEVLIIDDASKDKTVQIGLNAKANLIFPYEIIILTNPINQGYGGNQKIGYHYAIKNKFDYVALIHGDGQYAPECLPNLLMAFSEDGVDAVFGSRMMQSGAAIKGGMPLYKYLGNKILTNFENWMLKTNLTEFHSGYRIYSVKALEQIPFDLNTNDFHFDTEIIIQFILRGLKIVELPIPTYYGEEICHVNGIKYAADVSLSVVKMRANLYGIFYDRKFDITNKNLKSSQYTLKLDGKSPHTITLNKIKNNSKVLDFGCAAGYVGRLLQTEKACHVAGIDKFILPEQAELDVFIEHDLFFGPPKVNYDYYDYILMLDVIEHLPNPEAFIEKLYELLEGNTKIQILVSTGNVGFIITRLMLLMGHFNYGKRGILDLTHTRLFTIASFKRLFKQANYEVMEIIGVPAPFGLMFGGNSLGKCCNWLNEKLIQLSPGLFSYQIYMNVRPKPSLQSLLAASEEKMRGIINEFKPLDSN